MQKLLMSTARFGTALLASVIFVAGAGAQPPAAPGEHGEYRGAVASEPPAWFKQSFLELEEDVREAAEAGKRLMIYFHQHGCPYCNALIEHNLAQKDIAERLHTRFDVIAVNLWGDREMVSVAGDTYTEKSFAEALQVQFTPTLMFFNEAGKIVLRLNGYLPPQNFLLALNYVANGRETELSYRDYVAAEQPPPSTGVLNRQRFFKAPPYDFTLPPEGSWWRPLAVFFEQKRCPNCDTLHREVLTDKTTLALIGRFDVVQLDMWSDTPVVTPQGEATTARSWARRLGVSYAPTLVFFSQDGSEVIRSEAYFKVFHTQSMFDYVLNGGYLSHPSFQRYLSARADTLLEQGVDVDIWR